MEKVEPIEEVTVPTRYDTPCDTGAQRLLVAAAREKAAVHRPLVARTVVKLPK